ncbi:MAG: class I SAM-dependent methyltransferase [Desulfohalobiaceae bacterium]
MQQDRSRWNEKYRENDASPAPAATVRRFARLASAGRALDLAAGLGGNARFLAGLGFAVDALDISDVAVQKLTALGHPSIQPIQADLDDYPLPRGRYQLVCTIHFLDRSLFGPIQAALAPGGLLLYETHLITDQEVAGPKDPAYRLQPNELLAAFSGLRIVYYREGLRTHRHWGRLCLATLVGFKDG